MKKLLILPLILLFLAGMAQKGKELYPTKNQALLTIYVKNFEKKPVAKADLVFQGLKQTQKFTAKTDKAGIAQLLLPAGNTYMISVEDSANYDLVQIDLKEYLGVRHTTYYQGPVNGKSQPLTQPMFSMMPPKDGLAQVKMTFVGLKKNPLPNEPITLTSKVGEKTWTGITNANGKVNFEVPVGDVYQVGVKYNSNFDQFTIEKRGASAAVTVTYGYIGSAHIENQVRQRRLNDSLARVAYQIRLDGDGHTKSFRQIETSLIEPRFTKEVTSEGYNLDMEVSSALLSPFGMKDFLYLGGGFNTHQLYCIEPETGEAVWASDLGEAGPALIDGEDGTVVVITESCTIYALDALAGTLKWSKWLTPYMRSSPVVKDGRVYVVYEDRYGAPQGSPTNMPTHSIACFDLENGDICWQQWLHEDAITAPVVANGKVYLTTFDGNLYALNSQNGEIVKQVPVYATSCPTVVGQQLFLSFKENAGGKPGNLEKIGRFDASNLELISAFQEKNADYLASGVQEKSILARAARQNDIGNGILESTGEKMGRTNAKELIGINGSYARLSWQGSKVVAGEDGLYSVRGDELVALDQQTGARRWAVTLPGDLKGEGGFLAGPPAVADHYVISANLDGSIWVLDGTNGQIVWKHKTDESFRCQPVVMKEKVFAASTNGKLVAVQIGGKF
ncbi:MAG: PQQ-binding-like beta-propeller repeat protein [Bacteroidia bacterium]|nr:PQQ-binding-like beta-propeller repeat protein [Bacteroidia bacterium]